MSKWQPIDTAPHNEQVLLYCPDLGVETNRARIELGYASRGYRNAVRSTMSYHSWATHWMPLPVPPISQTGRHQLEAAVRNARREALADCRKMALEEAIAAKKTQGMDLTPAALASAGGWYDAARGMAVAIQNMIDEVRE
jgi:hypothetical protein